MTNSLKSATLWGGVGRGAEPAGRVDSTPVPFPTRERLPVANVPDRGMSWLVSPVLCAIVRCAERRLRCARVSLPHTSDRRSPQNASTGLVFKGRASRSALGRPAVGATTRSGDLRRAQFVNP